VFTAAVTGPSQCVLNSSPREDGYLMREQAETARKALLTVGGKADRNLVSTPYFSEEIRRTLVEK